MSQMPWIKVSILKGATEAKALEKSISLTELNSLKIFFRQLEQRDRDAIEEKVASLFQEYELLFSPLSGHVTGIFIHMTP